MTAPFGRPESGMSPRLTLAESLDARRERRRIREGARRPVCGVGSSGRAGGRRMMLLIVGVLAHVWIVAPFVWLTQAVHDA